ncbi:NAD-dependent epimerase/dehydratase family protein [Pseudomonas sp. F1_0610]|uniref:NAD-dependent epimerase/dehydratase family protein n=1 Tax=Pseudomonas sp. F1_0610 TaxID=3114284 RepID=UPI0039C4786B
MEKILLTGCSGFIGKALKCYLNKQSRYELLLAVREPQKTQQSNNCVYIDSLERGDFQLKDKEIDVVIHLAARAHVLKEKTANPAELFNQTNVLGTLNLARQAMLAGVKRFIFISSIGVNGASTPIDKAFTESTEVNPQALYALSKFNAEKALIDLCKDSTMELVIIRPPLVYAGCAPGNFQRLLKLVKTGLPIPLANVKNQRSFIALENLISFISCCIEHPAAANELFLISDDERISTPDLFRKISYGMNKKVLLFSFPQNILERLAVFMGKKNLYSQLCGSLIIDNSKAKKLLGWSPVISADKALLRAGSEFISKNQQ